MSIHSIPTDWYRNFFAGPSVRFWDAAMPHAVTQEQVTALVETLHLTPEQEILDIACGTGRHANALARRGHRVTGVDLSAESLALARERDSLGAVRYVAADLASWEPPGRFAAAYWIGNGFGYLPHADTARWLARLHAAMLPGALLLVETGSTAESILPRIDERSWYEAGGIVMLLENEYRPREGKLLTRARFQEAGRETEAYFLHSVYTVAEIERLFAHAGFRCRQVTNGPPGEAFGLGGSLAWFLFEA